ncbi:MAG: hypothetical protein H6574_15390 [Lewinellaceae bacterium]|nr:hypothetical protein [Saprospiraceae bacterium]MCB9332464.1 hypothetical protein [Lewinellaceae bacterium]
MRLFLLLFCLLSFCHLPAQTPQEARVGIYLMNLYDLNMDEHSFYADFYIWFKWKGEIDPTEIEFVNQVEKWSLTSAPSGDGSDSLLSDSTNYRIFRVEGRFFHSFMLSHFPLDQHDLTIQIENPEYDANELVYLPDTAGAAIRHTLQLVGWEMQGSSLQPLENDYRTNFGNPDENACIYNQLVYTIRLARPITYFLLKMMLPLAVVMLISIGALILHPEYIDMRASLPIGGLLTAVFLQQTYSDALPDTGYMVLMDKIYLLAYALISLVLLRVIRSGNRLMEPGTVPVEKIIRRDRRLALVFLLGFFLGVLILCL